MPPKIFHVRLCKIAIVIIAMQENPEPSQAVDMMVDPEARDVAPLSQSHRVVDRLACLL